VLEGKGPKDPLDRPFGSRTHSAVTQAALYALQLRIDWYLVTNPRYVRQEWFTMLVQGNTAAAMNHAQQWVIK
jgi:hypothetical protein